MSWRRGANDRCKMAISIVMFAQSDEVAAIFVL